MFYFKPLPTLSNVETQSPIEWLVFTPPFTIDYALKYTFLCSVLINSQDGPVNKLHIPTHSFATWH